MTLQRTAADSPSPPAELSAELGPGQEGALCASTAHCKTAETPNPTAEHPESQNF